jgi:hypothetical protein
LILSSAAFGYLILLVYNHYLRTTTEKLT